MGLHVHYKIEHMLTCFSRVHLFINVYMKYMHQINQIGLTSKLLALYFNDKFVSNRANQNYVRFLYDNLFKLLENVSDEQNITYSDTYEKKAIILLLLIQTSHFERESIESSNYLTKYKISLLEYFLNRLDGNVDKVFDFINAFGCISALLRSLKKSNSFRIDSQERILDDLLKSHLSSFNSRANENLDSKNLIFEKEAENELLTMFKSLNFFDLTDINKISKL